MYIPMFWFLIFRFYAFLGFIVETTSTSIEQKKFANRGFLVGPIIPVFGVGVVLLVSLLSTYKSDMLVVFVFGIIICGLVENFTGLILEKIFHNKWWDYSHYPDNINGRVCYRNLFLFGIASVLIVCYLHPLFDSFLNNLNDWTIIIIGLSILLLFIADVVYSTIIAYELRTEIIIVEELKKNKLKSLPILLENEIIKRLKGIRITPHRLFKAFPNLSNFKSGKLIKEMIEKVKEENKEFKTKLMEKEKEYKAMLKNYKASKKKTNNKKYH